MIKTLNKVGIEGIYFNIMAIHDKHTASIIINAERLKVFPLRWKPSQGGQLPPLLINSIGSLSFRQEKKK